MTKKLSRLAALLLALLLALGSAPALADVEKTTATGFWFDTVVTFTLYGADDTLMSDLKEACGHYEALLSKTVEGSDVWRINHSGGETVTVDPETWSILSRAKEISDLTGHAFSVTMGAVVSLWDFTGGTEVVPPQEDIEAALALVDDDKLILGDGYTVTLPAGMQIDLGGIAKGYIADQLAAMTAERASGAILNFGGNVYVTGEKPDGSAFKVGINDPKNPEAGIVGYVTVKDTTVVTSGTYERYFEKDGVLYHHILDPKTGSSAVTDLTSATVVGVSSMDADAICTACIVMGKEWSLQFMEEHGLNGLVIDKDNNVTLTKGFTDTVSYTSAQ